MSGRQRKGATAAGPGLVLSCEHATHFVPRRVRAALAGPAAQAALHSHRGWDPGALRIARALERETGATLVSGRFSRLVIDLNRPLSHPAVFSSWSRELPVVEKEELRRLHRAHWDEVKAALVGQLQERGVVVQLGVHSFTPELDPERRDFDLGVLYDPARSNERRFALAIEPLLREAGLRVRRNAPYRGRSAGLTTSLRRTMPADRYIGVELELNQQVFGRRSGLEDKLVAALAGYFSAKSRP